MTRRLFWMGLGAVATVVVLLLLLNIVAFGSVRSGSDESAVASLRVETLRALEEALLAFAGCAVIISHDRWFLDRIATHILAFEGDSQVVWFEGNYADYEADRKRRLGVEADQPHRIKYRKLA